jgi:hypothetical protein
MSSFDFSLVGAPFRMQPGLRRIAAGDRQLTASTPESRHLREKVAVLGSFPGQALVAVPMFDVRPVLRAIARQAALSPPLAFEFEERDGPGARCAAPLLGWSIVDGVPVGAGEPALGDLLRRLPAHQRSTALLCLAFDEDFALIDGATATVPWLAVCLPSRWAPADKVGRHFTEIHAPVADNAVLLAAAESLARLVTGEERWERFVWTISADRHLGQHPDRGGSPWPANGDASALAALASLRSERQTFIPLPEVRQAIFTIRVESEPLVDAMIDGDAAHRLHDALASMSPAVLAYKGLDGARDRLLAWLAARAAPMPTARP